MLRTSQPRYTFGGLLIALLLAACGAPNELPGPVANAGIDADDINWGDPIPDGERVSDVAALALPFTPIEPTGLGDALKIEATPPTIKVGEQAIIWVFDHPTLGTFWVSEQLGDPAAAQAEFEALASQPKEGCTEESTSNNDEVFGDGSGPAIVCYFGHHRFAKLSDGTPVFVTSGENTTAVHWFEELAPADSDALPEQLKQAAIEVVVIGPSSTLTESDALTAADLV